MVKGLRQCVNERHSGLYCFSQLLLRGIEVNIPDGESKPLFGINCRKHFGQKVFRQTRVVDGRLNSFPAGGNFGKFWIGLANFIRSSI